MVVLAEPLRRTRGLRRTSHIFGDNDGPRAQRGQWKLYVYTGAYIPYSRAYARVDAQYSISSFSTNISHAVVTARVNVPADGWYIINLYGYMYTNSKLDIYHYGGGSALTLIDSFDYAGEGYGYYDNPTLVELAAGGHYFHLVSAGTSSFNLWAVEAMSAL